MVSAAEGRPRIALKSDNAPSAITLGGRFLRRPGHGGGSCYVGRTHCPGQTRPLREGLYYAQILSPRLKL